MQKVGDNIVRIKSESGRREDQYKEESLQFLSIASAEKRNTILGQYSLSDQINIMRKAILTGDLTDLTSLDNYIDSVINS